MVKIANRLKNGSADVDDEPEIDSTFQQPAPSQVEETITEESEPANYPPTFVPNLLTRL